MPYPSWCEEPRLPLEDFTPEKGEEQLARMRRCYHDYHRHQVMIVTLMAAGLLLLVLVLLLLTLFRAS